MEQEKEKEKSAGRARSPGYPNVSLPVALARVRKVFEADRRNPIDREVVAKHLGYSGISGAADKAIASLMHYDLLERVAKGEVRVSQIAVDILHPENPQQQKEALLRAAFAPELFKVLKDRFTDDQLPSEGALRSFLIRQNFTERALAPVIESYAETYRYLEQQNAYESAGVVADCDQESEREPVVPAASTVIEPPPTNPPRAKAPLATPGKKENVLMGDERVLTTGLLSKGASFRLVVNGRIGVKEIERLIKKLELDKEILADEDDEMENGEANQEDIYK